MTDPDVQRLLDIEAIKALKARYCWYCDDPDQYHRFPELFTSDAVFIEEPSSEQGEDQQPRSTRFFRVPHTRFFRVLF